MLMRNKKNGKIRQQFIFLFFELVVIVIGVLLGLAVKDWETKIGNNKRAENTLFYIRQELHDNLAQFLSVQKQNEKVITVLDTMFSLNKTEFNNKYEDNKSFYLSYIQKTNLNLPVLKTNSWEYANRTGNISLLKDQLIIKLSDLYTLFDLNNKIVNDIISNLTVANNVSESNPDGFILSQLINYRLLQSMRNNLENSIKILLVELEGEQEPWFDEPMTIPGIIELEYFDKGGLGIAYMDVNINQRYNTVMREDESLQIQRGDSGNYFVAWANPGEWLEYTVNVQDSMYYEISVNYATIRSDNRFYLEMDDQAITEPTTLPVTGGWDEWINTEIGRAYLEKGEHILRLNYEEGTLNLDYIEFRKSEEQNE